MRDRLEALLKNLVARLVLAAAGRGAAAVRRASGPAYDRILVVRQHDQLGDMLCAIPLLNALRIRYPQARLMLVASPVNHDIMLHHAAVDDVLLYDKKKFLRSPSAALKFMRSLRKCAPDLAVVPATVSLSLTSDLLAIASGAPARLGASSLGGEPNPLARCYTFGAELDWSQTPRRHQALRNADVLAPLGIVVEDLSMEIGLTPAERRAAADELQQLRSRHKVVAGFHPGAGKPGNRWPASSFAAVANRLAAEGIGIVVTCGPMDRREVSEMRSLLRDEPLVIEGRPLRQVAAIIDQTDLFVSNDTGIMHIAGATGTRLLALFGPTDPLQWAPAGRKNRFIASADGIIASIGADAVYDMAKLMFHEDHLVK